HLLAAQQVDRALALVQDRVVPDFLRDPTLPAVLDLGRIVPSKLADAPERLLAIAADLLTWGDTGRGGEYLAQLERARPSIPPESRLAARFAAMRAFRHGLPGHRARGRGGAGPARPPGVGPGDAGTRGPGAGLVPGRTAGRGGQRRPGR